MNEIQIVVASSTAAWLICIPLFAFFLGKAHRNYTRKFEREQYIIMSILWPIMFVGIFFLILWEGLERIYETGKR